MPVKQQGPVRKQIRDLVTVLLLGVFCAIGVSVASLYYFGSLGRYKVENILLAPDIATLLSYPETEPGTGKIVHFVFDNLTLAYFDSNTKTWKRAEVGIAQYEQFYQLISGDTSLTTVPENVTALFDRGNEVVLHLMVRMENHVDMNGEGRTFQVLQIVPHGDYYRIQVRDQGEGSNWAYFFHENIYNDAMQLLAPDAEQ